MSITITRVFNPNTNNIDFDTILNGNCSTALRQAFANEHVNLSRGHIRMYSLLNLAAHNGSGANWKDGASYHTAADLKAYVARCEADIAAAVARAEAAAAAAESAAFFSTVPSVIVGAGATNEFAPASHTEAEAEDDFEDDFEDDEDDEDDEAAADCNCYSCRAARDN